MPFIHIKSLPFAEALDVTAVIEALSRDVARDAGIGIEHVHVTWAFLQPGHYAVAGAARTQQPESSHPLLVDLLAPDLNDLAAIETMLEAVATSLAKRTAVSRSNIFINYRPAHSGRVFDAGRVERW